MNQDDDITITLEDLRTVRKGDKDGYCLPGLQRWASDNGFSVKLLLKNGIKKSQLPRLDDPFAQKLLEAAEQRISKQGGK